MNRTQEKTKGLSCFWWVVIVLAGFFLLDKCNVSFTGNRFPFDTAAEEANEYNADLADMGEIHEYDPADRYDALLEDDPWIDSDDPYDSNEYFDGCPSGCVTHPAGCDIKGNIGFESGEKIYHLPGMEYYSQTTISPEYGERWFCTEAEARANGWRKAYE